MDYAYQNLDVKIESIYIGAIRYKFKFYP